MVEQVKQKKENVIPCRLCGGESTYVFDKQLLDSFSVKYYECQNCYSLQTEEPHWLEQAYDGWISNLDVSAVKRTLESLAVVLVINKILLEGRVRALDFGGGSGLLVRLLRDSGVDAYIADKYGPIVFAKGFEDSPGQSFDLITSFEVFEHLDNPAKVIDELFRRPTQVIAIGTCLWEKQGTNWFYLLPETGQHIFFFSTKGMAYIASKYNLNFYNFRKGSLTIFTRKKVPFWKLILLKILLVRPILRLIRAFVQLNETEQYQFEDMALLNHLKSK